MAKELKEVRCTFGRFCHYQMAGEGSVCLNYREYCSWAQYTTEEEADKYTRYDRVYDSKEDSDNG